MKVGSGKKALLSSALMTLLCGNALAVDMALNYEKKLKAVTAISPLSVDSASGEQISLYSGGLGFRVVDVSLPGNSGLPVELARTWQNDPDTRNRIKPFEDWELDIPYISSPVSTAYGWIVGPERLPLDSRPTAIDTAPIPAGTTHSLTRNRCSAAMNFSSPQNELSYLNVMPPSFEVTYFRFEEPGNPYIPIVNYDYKQIINTSQYWNSYQVNLPGQQRRPLLIRSTQNQNLPSAQHLWVTEYNMVYRCIPDDAGGEGFLGVAADGTQYYFDHLAYHTMRDAEVVAALPVIPSVDPEIPTGGSGDSSGSVSSVAVIMRRSEARLYASKIVDRFGNWVAFSYAGAKLTRISANDGREINIAHNGRGAIAQVTTTGRSWTYGYTEAPLDPSGFGGTPGFNQTFLTSVTNPDGSQWKYDLVRLGRNQLYHSENQSTYNNQEEACLPYGAEPPIFVYPGSERMEGTVETPSGLRYRYTVSPKRHNITYARGGLYTLCGLAGEPRYFDALSLIEKRVEGPGLQPHVWQFAYTQTPAKFLSECANAVNCGTQKSVDVTQPDNTLRRNYFGVRADQNLGMALGHEVIDNGVVKHRETLDYRFWPEGAPYPARIGHSILLEKNESLDHHFAYFNPPVISPGTALVGRLIPVNTMTMQRDGTTFTSSTNAFDRFSRPVSITKSNTLGHGKTETTTYLDDLSQWVLGLPLTSSVNGIEVSKTDYNAQRLPRKTYSFGKLQQTLSYWPDGNVNTVTDGRNNTISLGDYYHGIPRLISHPPTPEAPAGATESATVDPNGWITSVTDEIGAKTCYGYDPMGRLTSIVFPSETQTGVCDASRWSPIYISFQQINTPDRGLPAGHWRRMQMQGNRHTYAYMDALWRPVMELDFDISDNITWNTQTQVIKRYDASGRLAFQSYPTRHVGDFNESLPGTRTFYDALDRVTRVEQDSEHGVLATTTEYLTNLQARVVNPRGLATVTAFMAWDQPTYDLPIASVQPEGKVIEIARDPRFGWPLQLKQRSADNSVQQVRSYVYDGHAQLCKTIEPETGATVMHYDAAGNLDWSAAGLNLPGTTSCDDTHASVAARKATRSYDARNRLTQLVFPNGRGNQVWTYEKDNLPASVTAYNDPGSTTPVVTAYGYNKRRLLTGESSSQPGWYTWGIGYDYDSIGNLRSQSYPTGMSLDYAPNALGQSVSVRDQNNKVYASGASYYPNGALKQFTYGNGIVHTMTQNERQLPLRVTSSGGVQDFRYAYDYNGNVGLIADEIRSGNYSRWMSYDGLDRLTDAGSCNFGGDCWHRFTYNALDNLKSWKLAGVKDYADYVYNAKNQLTNIRNSAAATIVGLSYDPQGNLWNKNGQEYEFDYGNRLRSVIGKEYYRYDGSGRRVLTWRPAGVAGPASSLSLFQYSQSGQLMYEEHNDKPNGVHVYLAGSLIATRHGDGAVKYQHTDALGSPVAVTNEAGAVIERNDYEPYGAIIGKPSKSGIGYTGHMMDGVTGLTYMQQRYYDQSLGRFLSVDPVTASSANGSNFNRYWYANNNPYKFRDPDGRLADVVVDVGFIIYDVYALIKEPSWTNAGALGADAVGAVVPFATGLGTLVRGGAHGVDAARGAEKAADATQGAGKASDAAGKNDPTIYRMGTNKESPTRLGNKAAEAESTIGRHGVSGSTTKPSGPCSSASCSSLSAAFKVTPTPTRADPGHVTIELPKPVTKEVADKFNATFGR